MKGRNQSGLFLAEPIYVNNISSQNVREGKYGGLEKVWKLLKRTTRRHAITTQRSTVSLWLDSTSKTRQSVLATPNAQLTLTRPVACLHKSNLFHTSIKRKSPKKIYCKKTFCPFTILNRKRFLFFFFNLKLAAAQCAPLPQISVFNSALASPDTAVAKSLPIISNPECTVCIHVLASPRRHRLWCSRAV